MTRQVTDNLYIDLEYFTPEEYYTYEAVAEGVLASESTISCEASVVTGGEIVLGSGTIESFATMTVSITHIEGVDLFAFSEAAIAVQVERIRDNNTAQSTQFDIATDYIRVRSQNSTIDAAFEQSVFNIRGRDGVSTMSAAFSFEYFSFGSNVIRETTATLAASTTVSIDSNKLTPGAAALESTASISVDNTRLKLSVVSLVVESQLNVSVDITASADIDISLESNIIIDAEKIGVTFEQEATLTASIGLTTDADIIAQGLIQLHCQSTVTASIQATKEIILVAFDSASLTIQTSITIDNSISISSEFAQAATPVRIKAFEVDGDGSSSLTVNVDKLREHAASLSSSAELSIDNSRTRAFDSAQMLSSELTATISHIEGADIVIYGFGSLTCKIDDRLRDIGSTMSSTVSMNAVNGRIRSQSSSSQSTVTTLVVGQRIKFAQSTISTSASITAKANYLIQGRSTATIIASTSPTVNVNLKPYNDNDYTEYFYRTTNVSFQWKFILNRPNTFDELIDTVFYGTVGTIRRPVIQVGYVNGLQDDLIIVTFRYLKKIGTDQYQEQIYENRYYIPETTTNGLSSDTWRNFSVSAFVTQAGVVTLTATFPVGHTSIQTSQGTGSTYTLAITGASVDYEIIGIDEIQGNVLSPINTYIQNTTVSQGAITGVIQNLPTVVSADLIDYNFADMYILAYNVQPFDSAMTSSAVINTQSQRFRGFSSNFNSVASQLSVVTEVSELAANVSISAQLTTVPARTRAFDSTNTITSTQTTINTRARNFDIGINCTASMIVSGRRIRGLSAAATSTVVLSADTNRIRDIEPRLDSIATQLTAAGRNATGTILLEPRFTLISTPATTAGLTVFFNNNVELTTLAYRVLEFNSDAIITTTVAAQGDLRIEARGAVTLTTTMSVDADRITDITQVFTVESTLSANAENIIGIIADLASETTVAVSAVTTATVSSSLVLESTINTVESRTRDYTVTASAFNTQLTVGSVINIDPYLQLTVPQETRFEPVTAESRGIRVESETRVNIII